MVSTTGPLSPGAEPQNTGLSDFGGDFTNKKQYVSAPKFLVPMTLTSGWYVPDGVNYEERDTIKCAMLPLPFSQMPFPPFANSSDSELAALGTTAIARCAPTNSVANLSVALTELRREGLPHLLGVTAWKSRTRDIHAVKKAAGDEYLNVQFGWKPLLGDVQDVAKGVTRLSKLIEQAERDSGKVVRRRYSFPPIERQQTTLVQSATGPSLVSRTGFSSVEQRPFNQGQVYRYRETSIRQWFSGAFTYYLPERGDGLLANLGQASDILGLTMDPEAMWNLAPWSWAVDWFSNTGDYISNLSSLAKYGLVLRYGYIMEHSIVRDTYTFVGPTGFKSVWAFPSPVSLVSEMKLRRRATPFGFGLSGVLNNTQKAIIAALGISRGSR